MALRDIFKDNEKNLVTVVLTSCGRPDCLKTTIESFRKFNTFPIKEFIIIEDSGNKNMARMIQQYWPEYTLIFNGKNIGLVDSIDKAYSQVSTQYIFHCENDWEFYNPGFIEKSLEILLAYPEVMMVWLRDLSDTNGHPVHPKLHKVNDVDFKLIATNQNGWHGWSFNPGLRRLSDYKKVGPFGNIAPEYGKKAGYREMYIGQEYYKHGYIAAILTEGYCKHIGYVSKDYTLT